MNFPQTPAIKEAFANPNDKGVHEVWRGNGSAPHGPADGEDASGPFDFRAGFGSGDGAECSPVA